jgi:hypothetical protein
MAIQSASEFEAIIAKVVIRCEKALVERGSVVPLENAVRDLKYISAAARQSAKLKSHRALLETTTDVISKHIPDDSALLDQLWDLADYIDYRA